MTHAVDRRIRVMQAVQAVPGAHLRNLQRITDLAWGTLRYHTGVLANQGHIRSEMDRRFLRYYPSPMPVEVRRTWDAIRTAPTRRIMETLLEAPTSQTALAFRLDMAPSTTHRYVARLRALGVVRDAADTLCLAWPGEARSLLATLNPSLLDRLTDGAIGLFDQLEA